MQLSEMQFRVLRQLGDAGGWVEMQALASALGSDQSPVAAAATTLAEAKLVQVSESAFDEYRLDTEGEQFVSAPLPERVIVEVLVGQGGQARITDIPNHCGLTAGQVGQSLRWLAQRGWAKKEGEMLVLTDGGRQSAELLAASTGGQATRGTPAIGGSAPGINVGARGDATGEPDERMIRALAGGRMARGEELANEGIAIDAAVALLKGRKGFLTVKARTSRQVTITAAGQKLLEEGATGRKTVTQLTPELLADGGWRDVELQPYDVKLAAKKLYPGKEHPFQRTLDKVRRVFLEMGFTEIVSPWVESSFWDFDALFQPQDHPARDMQDTFYVAKPNRSKLPDEKLVQRVKATHENGGDTGSTGWQYRWSEDLARKPVLRTHTTAATIRALSQHKTGTAGKYFVTGPVFRRETVDYKHLPIFHQVDGIIVDKHASLSSLLGTLGAFYNKMGFSKVRFCPSFFPYTEPSAEVLIYLDNRKEWVEMGGSGIFRPEVTLPLGITDRVLAWGLGLERLAMMIHNLNSIGELYFATMPWLREAAVGRG